MEAIESVAQSYRRGIRRPLISLPTGTGKTIIFSAILKGAAAKDRRCIVLAHRDELIEQAADKLVQVAPELERSIGVLKAQRHEVDQLITVASVQSLNQRRLDRLAGEGVGWDVVICDEAHHAAAASYVRAFEAFGCFDDDPPLTIGVTATPQRADAKDLGEVWEEIVYHRDLLSMMRQGYLCNLRGISIKLAEFKTEQLRTRAGDFVAEEAGEALSDAGAPRHVVGAWLEHATGRKTIVFTPTIALAEETRAEYASRGVRVAMVSGRTPMEERRAILSLFNTGEIQVVCNAQVLTEGFDEPSVECIVIARPTKSQGLYVQMVGRGTRIHPGKADCLVMDVVGASERLDLTTLPRLFGLGEDAPEKPLDEDDGSEVWDTIDVLAAAEEREQRLVREGRIVATQVDLFSRQDLTWNLARPGVWCLGLQDEMVVLEVDTQSRWSVTVYPRVGVDTVIREGLDLHMAMGVAEEYARRAPSFAAALVDKAAAWRQREPSEKQLSALAKWKVVVPDGLTKGEANDLLTQAIALGRMQRRRR